MSKEVAHTNVYAMCEEAKAVEDKPRAIDDVNLLRNVKRRERVIARDHDAPVARVPQFPQALLRVRLQRRMEHQEARERELAFDLVARHLVYTIGVQ